MAERRRSGTGDKDSDRNPERHVEIYDPAALRRLLEIELESEWSGLGDWPPPAPVRTTEGDVWARCLHTVLDDPRGHMRPALYGSEWMAARFKTAVQTMGHFAIVTGLIERAIIQSARVEQPIRFPPVLMLSPPGIGKSYYCRTTARALGTTAVPIAINGTSDRGVLGGLSQSWRGAKLGRLARALLIDSVTAAPLFLLDELDKPPQLAGERTLDVLLMALEPENAKDFVDEYFEIPIRLDGALWLASANDTGEIPAALLSRMLIVDVPKPTHEQSAVIVEAIAAPILCACKLATISNAAVALLIEFSPRRVRQALELASAYAVYARHRAIIEEDVRNALSLVERRTRRPVGFLR